MILTGVFRYVRNGDVAVKLSEGWRYAAHLGDTHGRWSTLLWWCCGECKDSEVPR